MEVDRRSLALQNRQISIRMEQLTDRMVERTGLSTAQAHLLMRILRYGPEGTTLTELHRQCGYSMAALSNILKRLRMGGYVRAETTEADNRCKRLFATEKAEQVRAAFPGCALLPRAGAPEGEFALLTGPMLRAELDGHLAGLKALSVFRVLD